MKIPGFQSIENRSVPLSVLESGTVVVQIRSGPTDSSVRRRVVQLGKLRFECELIEFDASCCVSVYDLVQCGGG
jgi:hypothetical protein